MCAVSEKQTRVWWPFKAYKVVDWCDDYFMSPVPISMRLNSNWEAHTGTTLKYKVGEWTESPSGPGIFAYRTKDRAKIHAHYPLKILEIWVPFWAKIRTGRENTVMAASMIKVIREVTR